jgi:hypothetical protein
MVFHFQYPSFDFELALQENNVVFRLLLLLLHWFRPKLRDPSRAAILVAAIGLMIWSEFHIRLHHRAGSALDAFETCAHVLSPIDRISNSSFSRSRYCFRQPRRLRSILAMQLRMWLVSIRETSRCFPSFVTQTVSCIFNALLSGSSRSYPASEYVDVIKLDGSLPVADREEPNARKDRQSVPPDDPPLSDGEEGSGAE